jgi:hypothetical protein
LSRELGHGQHARPFTGSRWISTDRFSQRPDVCIRHFRLPIPVDAVDPLCSYRVLMAGREQPKQDRPPPPDALVLSSEGIRGLCVSRAHARASTQQFRNRMPLTRSFKRLVQHRMAAEPAFAKELIVSLTERASMPSLS